MFTRQFNNRAFPQDDKLFLQVTIKRACHPERSEGSEPTEHIFLDARVKQSSRSFSRQQGETLGKTLLQDDILFLQVTIERASHSERSEESEPTALSCAERSMVQILRSLPQAVQ